MSKIINKFLRFAKVNYDIVFGFIFFISYRYFFTWFLWHGRNIPPESDDSYFYLSAAHHFLKPENFEEFRLLLFSFWLNLVSLLTGGNLELAYKVNFYIGPILMFIAIGWFLKKLDFNKKNLLLIFIILSFYVGNGAYHGFYWVVPSFYQLLLFFVLIGLFFENKRIKLQVLVPIIAGFIFIHPSSPLILGIFALLIPLLFIIDRKSFKSYFEKSVLFLVIGIIVTTIYVILSTQFPQTQSPESPSSVINLMLQILHGRAQSTSWPIIWHEYFAIFLLNPPTAIASLLSIYFCWYAGAKKLLAVFFASLILVIFSVVIPYGYRTLAFTWPLTFTVIAYALIGFHQWSIKHLIFLKFLPAVALIIFAFVITNINLIWINSVNFNKNYSWDRSCPGKIYGATTFFNNNEALFAFQLYGLKSDQTILLTNSFRPGTIFENTYFVTIGNVTQKTQILSPFQEFLTKNVSRVNKIQEVSIIPTNYWNQAPISTEELSIKLSEKELRLAPTYDCGYFKIYKIQKI